MPTSSAIEAKDVVKDTIYDVIDTSSSSRISPKNCLVCLQGFSDISFKGECAPSLASYVSLLLNTALVLHLVVNVSLM